METLSIMTVNIECYRQLLRRRLGRTDRAMISHMLERAEARKAKTVAMDGRVRDSARRDLELPVQWSR